MLFYKKQIIKTILKQVKAGTPIYRCQLPIFVLEPRSLLESLTDFAGFSPLLLSMNNIESPELRFLEVLKFYLAGWHTRPKGVRSPYNPILGEVFKCQWLHPDSKTEYAAEQITHHPPSSAFCVWNREKQTVIQAYIKAITKFMGNSVEATLAGTLTGYLYKFKEGYDMTFPKYIVKGVLFGTMGMELGGKTWLRCDQSGFFAEIDFKSKHCNAVSGTIRHTSDKKKDLYIIDGRWDQIIKLIDLKTNQETVLIDISKLSSVEKIIAPLDQQEINESRRVWLDVTRNIRENKEDEALAAKSILENEQRIIAKKGLKWEPKLFHQKGETWEFNGLAEIFGELPPSPSVEPAKTSPLQPVGLGWLKKPALFIKKAT